MKKVVVPVLAAIAAIAAFGSTGRAADLGPMYTKAPPAQTAYPYRPWYVIGGGAVIFSGGSTSLTDRNCGASNSNIACGTPASVSGGGGWGIFGGLGYRWNPWFRTDLRVGYGETSASGTVTPPGLGSRVLHADYSSLNVLAHGFIDFAGLAPAGYFGIFEPYIGGGLGVANHRVTNVRFTAPGFVGEFSAPGGRNSQFAWTAAIGTGIRLAALGLPQNLLLDVAYRYRDFGNAQTDPGPITNNTVPCVGCTVGNGFMTHARAHGIDVALRYEF